MTQGKRIPADLGDDASKTIREMGAAAEMARSAVGQGQTGAAARRGAHIQTIDRTEAGEPAIATGHVLGLPALSGIGVRLKQPEGR